MQFCSVPALLQVLIVVVLKEILVELREWLDVNIIEGAIVSDHVQMYLPVPPEYSPASIMQILRKSAEYLRRELPELGKKYWGMHIGAARS